jgi:uncharacterized protein (DUF488 family)
VLAYTVGYGGLKPERFLALVRELGVKVVADVRRFPRSKLEFYAGERLRASLSEVGVEYAWFGELGALGLARSYRPGEDVACTGSPTFRAYVHYLVSDPRALAALARLRDAVAQGRTPLVLCRERKPEHCHRQFVADALVAMGVRVVHVVGAQRLEHRGSPCYSYIASRLPRAAR